MGYGYLKLHGSEGTCQSGVHIPHDNHQIGLLLQENSLKFDEDPPRLLAVISGADPEMQVRVGKPKIPEESIRHIGVIVLARVNKYIVNGDE
jgi:hypothetical protein